MSNLNNLYCDIFFTVLGLIFAMVACLQYTAITTLYCISFVYHNLLYIIVSVTCTCRERWSQR